ncbi:hypothetical protein [Aliikangiella sp. IMCC44359]|uniref:hypothetical protein n=1 Tax=Aliikangiella sp. IMCC44359 TaxID=3459125 RepID=UPI00403AB0B6
MKKLIDSITDDGEITGKNLRLLSLLFLATCGAMSLVPYTKVRDYLPDTELVFTPGLISTVVAIFIISPLYLRNILRWNKSVYTLVSLVLILMVFASFIELAVGGDRGGSLTYALLASSLILSWLGIQAVAGFGWVLTFAAGILSLLLNHIAMGFYGFIYITTGFIGLVLHSGLNPGSLIKGIKVEYGDGEALKSIKEDVSDTANMLEETPIKSLSDTKDPIKLERQI